MPDTGWLFPGTTNTRQNLSNNPWADPDNCKADDFTYATCVGTKFDGNSPGDGPELITYNYGFSVPSSATIVGIEVEVQQFSGVNATGEVVYLKSDDVGSPYVIAGNHKTDDFTDMQTDGQAGGSPVTTHIYGSPTDTWGAGLTPADVNSSNFGFITMAYDDAAPLNTGIDYIKMKIHYEFQNSAPIVIMVGV